MHGGCSGLDGHLGLCALKASFLGSSFSVEADDLGPYFLVLPRVCLATSENYKYPLTVGINSVVVTTA